MDIINEIKKDLRKVAVTEKIPIYQNFFKTGKGDYGEGDIFLGIYSDDIKIIAKKYKSISLDLVKNLLESKIHEERVLAMRILVEKYNELNDDSTVKFYKKHNKKINNWDLVDLSADKIIGHYYYNNKKKIKELYKLAKSDNLWERRTAIIATFYFIRKNQFKDTIKISEILLNDKHDLIQKAVGWMLREIGKKDKKTLVDFIKKHYKNMPRTMLRYSIEKFPEKERKDYLLGKVN
ncbi:MAG: DNA alkylation repair protein [Nanoarchaeota archaeon]